MASRVDKRLIAPCVASCPAQVDVPRYIGYIAEGKFAQAHATVREAIPLPVVCGLICYRPCEPWCRRGIMEEPIAINALKRAAHDHDASHTWRRRWKGQIAQPTGKRVAIVGSGPAGLTAAYYLARRKGHRVTLFEAQPELGGQLRTGLPEYKVPRDQLRDEIELIVETRVEVRTGTKVSSLEDLVREYDAVLLAVGQVKPEASDLDVDGTEGAGWAASFLRDVNLGRPWPVGPRVAILGGDNIAFDSARCAVRLGAREVEVLVPGRRSMARAHDFEIAAAEEEGVQVRDMVQASSLRGAGGVVEILLRRLRVAHTDEVGREALETAPGRPETLTTDMVLVSLGQQVDAPASWDLKSTAKGLLKVDGQMLTTRKEVFAAGDAVTGPASIVDAMDQGKQAAIAIDSFLGGDGDITEVFAPRPGSEMRMPPDLAPKGDQAVAMPVASAVDRQGSFAIVEQGYGVEEAKTEARRCIRCDLWRIETPEVWSQQEE